MDLSHSSPVSISSPSAGSFCGLRVPGGVFIPPPHSAPPHRQTSMSLPRPLSRSESVHRIVGSTESIAMSAGRVSRGRRRKIESTPVLSIAAIAGGTAVADFLGGGGRAVDGVARGEPVCTGEVADRGRAVPMEEVG